MNGAISDVPAHIWADKDPKEFEILSTRGTETKSEEITEKKKITKKKGK